MRRLVISILLLGVAEASAREPRQIAVVRVVVPPAVLFDVPNVTTPSAAASGPVTVSFDSAVLGPGQVLRISVRADGDLTMPGGAAIPASNISWTVSNVSAGIGMTGVLSKTIFTPVYQSNVGATSGHVDVSWTLAAPGSGIRAGTRQAALRWRFEAIVP